VPSTTIDIDTGGTFTDAFVVRDGQAHTVKVLTTPHDLTVCFQEVVERAAEALGLGVAALLRETACVRYATTVGTNAVIQRTGPRLGLLVSPGDEATAGPALGRFVEADMIGTSADDGDDGELVRTTKRLLDGSARALVCSLPAGDAAAERRVRAGFERHYPKHCLDAVPLLLSHEVDDDPDDTRRTSTALFNAYLHPDVARYLHRCEDWLRDHGYRRPLLVVHNDGGCARVAKTIAGKTYNSGPTAGLMGAEIVARLYGLDALVTFDVGGTSLDVGIVRSGELAMHEHGTVEGVELSFAMPDLHVLGAGGGSIAHVGPDGVIEVGPRSAGARPGPAAFALGGTEPTVTDADVVLGIIDPERFLGGTMPLDAARARDALATLGEDPDSAAEAVRARLHATMGTRIALELAALGIEPSSTTLLAYGGAGPTHAAGVAESLGVRDVITLPFSAVFSAFGAQSADVTHRYAAAPGDDVEDRLRARAARDMRGEGFSADDVELQTTTVTRHGVDRTQVLAVARLAHHAFAAAPTNGAGTTARTTRTVRWPGSGEQDTAIHDVGTLHPGARVDGPAVIEATDTTIAVPPGWAFSVDEYGNGRLRHGAGAEGAPA